MDLMRDFVRDRTIDLQRLAADVRRERDLRQVETTAASAVAPVASAAPRGRGRRRRPTCDGAECAPATVARHAA